VPTNKINNLSIMRKLRTSHVGHKAFHFVLVCNSGGISHESALTAAVSFLSNLMPSHRQSSAGLWMTLSRPSVTKA
jgi:hypothetical protein